MKQPRFELYKFYHLYNRGNNNENIFLNEGNYLYFLNLVSKYLLPICDIYSYCLLPNHFHLIIKLNSEIGLPRGLDKTKLHQPFSNLFNTYTKAVNKQNKRNGSLFQEHLKRIEIKNTDYLRRLIIYVNTNSTHHGIKDYKSYKHPSYHALIGINETQIKRDRVVELFDDVENMKYMFEKKREEINSLKSLTFE